MPVNDTDQRGGIESKKYPVFFNKFNLNNVARPELSSQQWLQSLKQLRLKASSSFFSLYRALFDLCLYNVINLPTKPASQFSDFEKLYPQWSSKKKNLQQKKKKRERTKTEVKKMSSFWLKASGSYASSLCFRYVLTESLLSINRKLCTGTVQLCHNAKNMIKKNKERKRKNGDEQNHSPIVFLFHPGF